MTGSKLLILENIYSTGIVGTVAGHLLAARADPSLHFPNRLANAASIQDCGVYVGTPFQNPERYSIVSIPGCKGNLTLVF